MRVNVYAEEMTDRVEIIEKETADGKFTGLRFYLELPVTVPSQLRAPGDPDVVQVRGPFMHHKGDDDSAAVTFWGKRDLRAVLRKALALLDAHYEKLGKDLDGVLPCDRKAAAEFLNLQQNTYVRTWIEKGTDRHEDQGWTAEEKWKDLARAFARHRATMLLFEAVK